jgi:Lrp/AsnC family transcriptional regulator, leucine-responsive regulatory protein
MCLVEYYSNSKAEEESMAITELDATDIEILELLQSDGRISNAELAQRVGLAPATVLRRVKLLEERGYIRGYVALVDPLRLGLHVTAYVMVETDSCNLATLAQDIPEVQEVHHIIGEWCAMLKVRTQTPQTLERIIHDKIRRQAGVRRTMTILVTSSPVENTQIPLPEPSTVAEHAL